jgi:hypothetical protein
MVYLQMSMGGDLCAWHQVDYNKNFNFNIPTSIGGKAQYIGKCFI